MSSPLWKRFFEPFRVALGRTSSLQRRDPNAIRNSSYYDQFEPERVHQFATRTDADRRRRIKAVRRQ